MIFIDVAEGRFVGQLQGRHTFKSLALSPDGCVLSTILMDAKYVATLFRIDPFLVSDIPQTDDAEEAEVENAPGSKI